MPKPIIICEDSAGGLYMWAAINKYIFQEKFNLKISNPDFFYLNITLESFNGKNLARETILVPNKDRNAGRRGIPAFLEREIIPSAGIDLVPECLAQCANTDTVLLAIDLANSDALFHLNPVIDEAIARGMKVEILGYNCATEIMLSFRQLQAWCAKCKKYEKRQGSEIDIQAKIDYDQLLSDLQNALHARLKGSSLIKAVRNFQKFQYNHILSCVHSGSYQEIKNGARPQKNDLSVEHTLDFLFDIYTRDSRLSSNKYELSKCFRENCGCFQYHCCRSDTIEGKWTDIFNGSTLCTYIREASLKLDIYSYIYSQTNLVGSNLLLSPDSLAQPVALQNSAAPESVFSPQLKQHEKDAAANVHQPTQSELTTNNKTGVTSAFDKLKGQNLPDHTHEFD